MKRTIFSLLTFFFVFSSVINAEENQPTSASLKKFIASPNLKVANISVLVRDLDSGKEIAEYRSLCDLIPASVTKVITTASGLELLTDTFRFRTRLQYDGYIKDSILHGNIYIKGGGDPTFGVKREDENFSFFSNAAQAITSLGIKCIDGNIVGDASLFFESGSPQKWLVEDVGSSYSPTPSALSFSDNLLSFDLITDSTSAHIENVEPYTSLFAPELRVKITERKTSSCRISKPDYSWSPIVFGSMPRNFKEKVITEIPDPAKLVADSLRRVIERIGIQVTATPAITSKEFKQDSVRKTLYTHTSKPLKNIIQQTNYKSINLYAENIFSYIGLRENPEVSFRANSAKVIAEYWAKRGLQSSQIFQLDGSGLSMQNAINSRFLVDILTYMKKKSKYSDSFVSSIPTCGVSGTVKSLLAGTPLSGKVQAKSGSMERVQNYCGYISWNGKNYVFSIMINNFNGTRKAVRQDISNFLNAVVKE